jgi:uncharacterized membrane protein
MSDVHGAGSRATGPDPGPAEAGWAARSLALVGLALVGVALAVPFGQNEAGCSDHCAPAHRFYVWHPLHNPGALFLFAGVVGMAAACFGPPAWRAIRPARLGLAAVCGWAGVYLTQPVAPRVVAEVYLYGGPELEPRAGGDLAVVGFMVLFLAAAPTLVARLCAPRVNP